MADTFDRVKLTEEAELIMARARFIDACEAELDEPQLEAIKCVTRRFSPLGTIGFCLPQSRDWEVRARLVGEREGVRREGVCRMDRKAWQDRNRNHVRLLENHTLACSVD